MVVELHSGKIILYINTRGVTVHKYDSSVCTSVLTSRFSMISVEQGDKYTFFMYFLYVFFKLLFLYIHSVIFNIFLVIKIYLSVCLKL